MFVRDSQVLSKPRKSAFLVWTQEHDEQIQEKVQ